MFCIYRLRNPHNSGEYVGHTNDYDRRMSEHRRDLTVECTDFEHEILFDNIPSRAEALEMEKVFIDIHGTFDNGYNETRGGGRGTELSGETKEKMRQSALKRVEDGTHHLLDGEIQREMNRQRVADGTHNFLGGELNRQRIEDGTHHFLGDGEFQREIQRQRVADGTHPFLGGDLQHQRVADGTHPFLGGEIQRQRIADGTHNFLGDSNPSRRRIADGTHNFCDSEFQLEMSRRGNAAKARKKQKAQWMWIRSLAGYWDLIYPYVIKRRAEFYDKDIPDTSIAEQIELF